LAAAIHPSRFQIRFETVNLSEGMHIVIFAAPDCVFCRRLANDILSDPYLTGIFEKDSSWVVVPDLNISRDYLASWNKKFPKFPQSLIFTRTGWPEPESAGTPVIEIIHNGDIVFKHRGWNSGRDLSALREAVGSIESTSKAGNHESGEMIRQ
jgi:hypothetical protein